MLNVFTDILVIISYKLGSTISSQSRAEESKALLRAAEFSKFHCKQGTRLDLQVQQTTRIGYLWIQKLILGLMGWLSRLRCLSCA